jgi:hypothetical protein
MLILGGGESLDFKSMRDSTLAYELGPPQADGDLAIVEAKIQGPKPEGGTEPAVQTLPLVLRRAEGAWKVDMGASIQRMLGFNLEEVMTQMAEGLGSALGKGMEAMAEGMTAALSPPAAAQGEEPGFRETLDYVRQTALPDEVAAMSQALGKELEVVVAWHSLGGSVEAAGRLAPLVLSPLSEAVRRVAEDPEEREKLFHALERVVLWHVRRPEERVCVLDAGQLELAACLLDAPGQEGTPGSYAVDEIVEVLRRACA